MVFPDGGCGKRIPCAIFFLYSNLCMPLFASGFSNTEEIPVGQNAGPIKHTWS